MSDISYVVTSPILNDFHCCTIWLASKIFLSKSWILSLRSLSYILEFLTQGALASSYQEASVTQQYFILYPSYNKVALIKFYLLLVEVFMKQFYINGEAGLHSLTPYLLNPHEDHACSSMRFLIGFYPCILPSARCFSCSLCLLDDPVVLICREADSVLMPLISLR